MSCDLYDSFTAEYGVKKIIVTYDTLEQAQRAATLLGDGSGGTDPLPRVSRGS